MMNAFILAQAAAPGPGFWQVMEHVGLLGSLVAVGIAWTVMRRKREHVQITPQPLEVRAATEFVRKLEFVESREGIERQIGNINSQLAEVRRERVEDARAAAKSRSELYRKVDEVKSGIGEMERRVNAASEERTGHVHDRINEVLSAVSELRGEMRNRRANEQN